MTRPAPSPLAVEPLTERLWPAFAELLDQGGPAGRCWCMAARIGAAYRHRPPEQNRDDFRAVVQQGPPPGLVALAGETAFGWCQITPRAAVPAHNQGWRVRPVDDVAAWAITCFYVRKGYRRQGITSTLIGSAVDFARAAGAPAVEAYPLDGSVSPSATATGYASTFTRLGFIEIARRSPERPIVRLTF